MKLLNSRTLLNLALLGAFAIAPLATPVAKADPPDHAPAYGRRAKENYKKDKKDKHDKRDDNDRDDHDDNDRDDYRNQRTYTGTVTNVRSGNSFDLRSNGRIYHVFTSSRLPRGLSRGDEVRVYGRPYNNDNVRNASVTITDNDRNDRDDRDDRNDSFRGIVTNIRNDREFDLRVGVALYRVYASYLPRDLSRGDEVRVSGRRDRNDIRNASVSITRNR